MYILELHVRVQPLFSVVSLQFKFYGAKVSAFFRQQIYIFSVKNHQRDMEVLVGSRHTTQYSFMYRAARQQFGCSGSWPHIMIACQYTTNNAVTRCLNRATYFTHSAYLNYLFHCHCKINLLKKKVIPPQRYPQFMDMYKFISQAVPIAVLH